MNIAATISHPAESQVKPNEDLIDQSSEEVRSNDNDSAQTSPSSSHTSFENQLAEALVANDEISEKQLGHAKRVKSKLAQKKPLMMILQDLGFITKDVLLKTLTRSSIKAHIGLVLVHLGFLNESDLRNALKIQKERADNTPIGRVLVESHLISDDKLTAVIAAQLGIPKIDPTFSKVDRKLLEKITPAWCTDFEMMPLGISNGRVLVCMTDPSNKARINKAEEIFGSNILIAICTVKSITEACRAFDRIRKNNSSGNSKAEESETVSKVNQILADAIEVNASDIHIEPIQERLRIRFRCDGVMTVHSHIEKDLAASILGRFKIMAGADIAEKRHHQDGRIQFEDPESGQSVDLRASFYITIFGEKLVLRVLKSKVEMLSVEELGLFPRSMETFYNDVLDVPSGIILVTGPTGSGKTTTLYSCVNYLNNLERSIITAEDPVEYLVEGISQCSLNPKINLTYESTLPAMVRQDPDVIVLGEIRDNFSAEAAIQAALTGHKVLTTFHTEDTIGSLLRLMNMNIETFLISSTVVSVLAQRLIRRLCRHCAERTAPTVNELNRLGYNQQDLGDTEFYTAKGCNKCRHAGYSGRLGAYELLVLNEQVKDAILQNKSSYEIRRISFETSEMTTLLEDGLLRAAAGLTSLQEVLKHLPRIEKPRPIQELKRLAGIR